MRLVCVLIACCVLSAHVRADRGDATVVTIRVMPSQARLRIDGVVHATGEPLQLSVGAHVLELDAEGFVTRVVPFDARGDEQIELAITLDVALSEPASELRSVRPYAAPRMPTLSTTPVPALCPVSPVELHPHRRWWWAGLGVAASTLALALGFRLTSHHTSTLPAVSDTPVAIRPGP